MRVKTERYKVMHRLGLAARSTMMTGAASGAEEIVVNGTVAVCDPLGGLYLPETGMLVVSDLHLEKGAAFARRGMMLPPYDTAATLELLALALERHQPKRVVCLGDSFHDRHGAAFMPAASGA